MDVVDWTVVVLFAISGASYAAGNARRAVGRLRRWRRQRDLPADPAEAARRAYYEKGTIDEAELEYRLEVAFDPERDRLRSTLEQAHGIGPSTSAALREQFGTVEAVRAASREELAGVAGVGEERAATIRALFDE